MPPTCCLFWFSFSWPWRVQIHTVWAKTSPRNHNDTHTQCTLLIKELSTTYICSFWPFVLLIQAFWFDEYDMSVRWWCWIDPTARPCPTSTSFWLHTYCTCVGLRCGHQLPNWRNLRDLPRTPRFGWRWVSKQKERSNEWAFISAGSSFFFPFTPSTCRGCAIYSSPGDRRRCSSLLRAAYTFSGNNYPVGFVSVEVGAVGTLEAKQGTILYKYFNDVSREFVFDDLTSTATRTCGFFNVSTRRRWWVKTEEMRETFSYYAIGASVIRCA